MRRQGNYGKHVQQEYKKRLRIERILLVLILFITIILLIFNISQNNIKKITNIKIQKENFEVSKLNEEYQIETLPDITISMAVIGDIMCHNTQYKTAYSNGKYDFSHVFEDIKSKIEPADIAIGNVVGSNIFNIGMVLGVPITIFGNINIGTFNILDLGFMFLSSLALFIFAGNDYKITKKEGLFMLFMFVVYYGLVII